MAGSRVFMNNPTVASTTILPKSAHTSLHNVLVIMSDHSLYVAPSPETRGLHESGEGEGGKKLDLTMHTIPQ